MLLNKLLITSALAVVSWAGRAPNFNGYRMLWEETFSGPAGSTPNLNHWDIITNFRVNNEVQDYTRSNRNLQLSGGETVQLVPWKNGGAWTSGRIESKVAFTPPAGGRLVIQAKLRTGSNPNRQGIWPAFWLMGDSIHHGTDWPRCGEIDVFEQINGAYTSYATVHCQQPQGGVCNEPVGISHTTPIPDNEFHTWSLMWDRTNSNWRDQAIIWLKDGIEFHRLTGARIGDEGVWGTLAHSPYFILLNVAVGGFFPGPPNDATQDGYGSMLEVQYVAAYQSV